MSPTILPRTAVGGPCAKCERILERSAREQTGTGLRHVSRRLCTTCYAAVHRAGELDRYPPIQRDPGDLLDEYAKLRAEHPRRSLTWIAARMEIPRSSLSRVLATYAADPRSDHNRRGAERVGKYFEHVRDGEATDE